MLVNSKPMHFYVLKVGGSLIASSRELIRSLFTLADEGYSFLVVPGGGPMADLVWDLFIQHKLSEEAAHWMAILAMEQYAHFLADGTGARLTGDIRRPHSECPAVEILLPYQAMQEDDFGLEHNWSYTSDSVAMLVAFRLGSALIKATDVDGVIFEGEVQEELCASSLVGKESCIDQGTLWLLQ
ncbi:MAG TPA: uridylate kinase, partial [Methanothrix sp.]|nr:uridylate kinase [Methanothrix sp.]